jgi:hypothetical protein
VTEEVAGPETDVIVLDVGVCLSLQTYQ